MSIVENLTKEKAITVMGIDASTHSLAFAVFDHTELVKHGKINFYGDNVYDRLVDANKKVGALISQFDVDYIAIERAVNVNSIETAIKMGMFLGVIISYINRDHTKIAEVFPRSWQLNIGNGAWTSEQKKDLRLKSPGRSESWRKAYIREQRKQYTIKYFNDKFGLNNDDNDVADAIGIAWYALENLTHA